MRYLAPAATALSFALATPSAAQMETLTYAATGAELAVSGLMFSNVFAHARGGDDAPTTWDGTGDGWAEVGTVHDVLFTADGRVQAVLIDVGGVLGVGEKRVAVTLNGLDLRRTEPEADLYDVLLTASQEQLELAPEYVAANRVGLGTERLNVTGKPERAPELSAEEVVEAGGEKPASMIERE